MAVNFRDFGKLSLKTLEKQRNPVFCHTLYFANLYIFAHNVVNL